MIKWLKKQLVSWKRRKEFNRIRLEAASDAVIFLEAARRLRKHDKKPK